MKCDFMLCVIDNGQIIETLACCSESMLPTSAPATEGPATECPATECPAHECLLPVSSPVTQPAPY